MTMNKSQNDRAVEQQKRLHKALEIINDICTAAIASEDGNSFNQWVIENSEKWKREVGW